MIVELLKSFIMTEASIAALLAFGATTCWDGEPHYAEGFTCLVCLGIFAYMYFI